jgi:PhzF family phenazine biosynthesis protein
MPHRSLHRLTAFSDHPQGGNPAGVWIGDTLPNPAEMQRIATEVGFSETAFIAPTSGNQRTIRYFSPEIEVPFCGHATIASGVLLGETASDGTYHLETAVGLVPVSVCTHQGVRTASLTSVTPQHNPASPTLVSAALAALAWGPSDLDSAIPPARAYAGAWHLVLATKTQDRLANLHYAFDQLKQLMLQEGLTTLQLVWRQEDHIFHARNPFPVGGIVEDPATGAAAAALGGYLRDAALIPVPATILIRQGEAMGRPSRITVDIPSAGGIIVSGTAVHLKL